MASTGHRCLLLSEEERREQEERSAITELLFSASTGNVARMQALIALHNTNVKSPGCCDYDRRTPLHLAAAEGKISAAKWLLDQGCTPNPVDRFFRTPLEDAMNGSHVEVQQLLLERGGKYFRKGVGFVDCTSSDGTAWEDQSRGSTSSIDEVIHLRSNRCSRDGRRSLSFHSARGGGAPRRDPALDFLQEAITERNPELRSLHLDKLVGRGSFGRVYKAKWRGCTVAVKVLSHDRGQSSQVNALHESVVSTHVSHPNVITTYKVHKVEHPDSRHSSMDEQATRAMSGALSSLSLSNGRAAANPMGGGENVLSPKAAAFMEVSSRSSCFTEVAAAPARADSGADDELMLCFTETGCVLRESASFNGEVPKRLDSSGLLGRSISTTCLASPFAATIDLARSGRLSSIGGMDAGPGPGTGSALPPKPRGIERRAATELPVTPSGQHAPMAGHGSCWARQLEQAGKRRGSMSNPPSDPDSHFLAINDHGTEVAKTLIVMEFADIGSLDQYAVRTSFKRNLMCCLLCLCDIALGMKYLHSLGLLHSDLKGANVLVKSAPPTPIDPRGVVCKIADFGMSRVLAHNKSHVSTDTHGTVAYMAPEVLQMGSLSMSADVYSFAMIMLELWTGEAIYKDLPAHQVLFKVFSGHRPPVPPDIPAGYLQLMTDCWASEPAQRPSFVSIMARLQDLLNANTGSI